MKLKGIHIFLTTILVFNWSTSYSQKSFFEEFGTIKPVRQTKNLAVEGWQNFYFSTDDCKCVNGGEFFVALKETASRTGNLMISLQGGGACWPGSIQCKSTTKDADVNVAKFTEQLNQRLKSDWGQVVIPYCDGSIYMGDTEQDYDLDNQIDHWHSGLKNSMAALRFVYTRYPNASKIFLTGCSDGGYGTIIQLRIIRHLYPEASIYVLNESGPGLLKPQTDFWKMITSSWNLDQILPKNCELCKGQLLYWYSDMLKDSKVKIALYSSYTDSVISQAFLKIKPEVYKSLLLNVSKDLNSNHPDRFKRFFIKGDSHCVEDRDYDVKGLKYWDWVVAFLNDSETWKDVLE